MCKKSITTLVGMFGMALMLLSCGGELVASRSVNQIQVEKPIMNPTTGSYSSDTAVTISCATEGADIYYTTDGSTPTKDSSPYLVPLLSAVTARLKQ